VSDDREERIIGSLRIRIDRDLCVGFGDCIDEARAFRLDDEGVAVFDTPTEATREALLRACDACPVDAITVWDGAGKQLVPVP
jgi:ferredoxin